MERYAISAELGSEDEVSIPKLCEDISEETRTDFDTESIRRYFYNSHGSDGLIDRLEKLEIPVRNVLNEGDREQQFKALQILYFFYMIETQTKYYEKNVPISRFLLHPEAADLQAVGMDESDYKNVFDILYDGIYERVENASEVELLYQRITIGWSELVKAFHRSILFCVGDDNLSDVIKKMINIKEKLQKYQDNEIDMTLNDKESDILKTTLLKLTVCKLAALNREWKRVVDSQEQIVRVNDTSSLLILTMETQYTFATNALKMVGGEELAKNYSSIMIELMNLQMKLLKYEKAETINRVNTQMMSTAKKLFQESGFII